MNKMDNYNSKPEIEYAEKSPKYDGSGVMRGCFAIAIAILIFTAAQVYLAKTRSEKGAAPSQTASVVDALAAKVVPENGLELPVTWGDLGKRMADAGVIDQTKFAALYASRGGMGKDVQSMLQASDNGKIRITPENAGGILNLLWALGLSNKSPILEKGEMVDSRYGGAEKFASTGGWTLAKGGPMDHYSMHQFMTLDAEAMGKVDRVTRNIYRPCCGNSTHFPDCNHGMAMLGLMELMAFQGASEQEMYKAALVVNSYWFPDTYLTIAHYLENKGVAWGALDPKDVLGADFSSVQGYQRILTETQPIEQKQSGSCGV